MNLNSIVFNNSTDYKSAQAEEEQYYNREESYFEMLKEFEPEKLMNDKKPDEFRKELYKKRRVRHLH